MSNDEPGQEPSTHPPITPSSRRLDSWKEIAAYLTRDIRTVQLWEKQEGLPVRRHFHLGRASVYAYTSELEAWRESRGEGVRTAGRGKSPGEAVGSTSPARSTRRPWAVWAGAAVATLGVIGAAAYFYLRHRESRRPPDQDTIVLADFTNTTGDPVFDGSLKTALRVQLEQSPFLNVLSDVKVIQELGYIGQPRDAPLTVDLAREVCQRTGTKAMLVGSVSKLGSRYMLGVEAINCQTGASLSSALVEADSREHVLAALDHAATRMRTNLGESLASVEKYDAPIDKVTTRSLEALQAYSLGLKTRAARGDEAGIPFLERATKLDPNFAMAYARLGTMYADLDEHVRSSEACKRAYGLRDRVSEREKLYIESRYYGGVTGQLEKTAEVYELWQHTFRRDPIPYDDRGDIYAMLGQYDEALGQFREAQRLDPSEAAISSDLAAGYLQLNRLDEAEKVLAEAQSRHLNNFQLLFDSYVLAFLRGDRSEMERQLEAAMGKAGIEDALLAAEADTEAYHGHLAQARELTRRSTASARQTGNVETAAGYQVAEALREAEFGNAAQARNMALAALSLAPGPVVRTLAALALAQAGERARARVIADELSRQSPGDTLLNDYWLPTIRAAAAEASVAREGTAAVAPHASKAVELLQSVRPYEFGTPPTPTNNLYSFPVYLRGKAYLALREGDQAAAEFQKILDHPGIVLNCPLGALAHLGLGRARVLSGDRPGARVAYQDFLTLWKDADPDIPVLKQARAEYAELQRPR